MSGVLDDQFEERGHDRCRVDHESKGGGAQDTDEHGVAGPHSR